MEKFLTIALFMVIMSLLACSIGGLATMVLPFIVVFGTGLLSLHMVTMNMRHQMGLPRHHSVFLDAQDDDGDNDPEQEISQWTQSMAGFALNAASWVWTGGRHMLGMVLPDVGGKKRSRRRAKCRVQEESEEEIAAESDQEYALPKKVHAVPKTVPRYTRLSADQAHNSDEESSDDKVDERVDIDIPVKQNVRKLKIHIHLSIDDSEKTTKQKKVKKKPPKIKARRKS